MISLKALSFKAIAIAITAISFYSFNSQALTFDSEITPDLKAQMTNDLGFMAQIRGSDNLTPAHVAIYGKMDGESYKNFFESRVFSIGKNSCGSDGKAVACVIPFFDPNKMWITDNYINFSHPQIARLMIIYHEARHTESDKGNWHHATCPTPFLDAQGNEIKSIWTGFSLAGEPACDSTIYGSYGSSTILLHNISVACTNCSDKVKMDAKIYSDDQAKRLIGKAPGDLKKDYGG